jgi:hypothetical protein
MITFAVGVEIVYFESKRRNGFPVISLGQLLGPGFFIVSFFDPDLSCLAHKLPKSFVPVALVAPLAIFWRWTDQEIRRIQPYITASQGNAPAERSVLLDYTNAPAIYLFINSLRFRHWLVFISASIAAATTLLQPLTAAIFTTRQTLYLIPDQPILSTATLGLRSDFNDLDAFAAAAGYVAAAVALDLDDPPFVCGGWSVADFDYETLYNTVAKNGTVSLATVGTKTTSGCQPVDSITRQGSAANWTGTYQGCSASFSIDDGDLEDANFGVVRVDNCAVNGTIPPDPFKPVMFWFYGSNGQGSMTFCLPRIEEFNVIAELTLFNDTLTNVTILSESTTPTNVTSGPPLDGLALNG